MGQKRQTQEAMAARRALVHDLLKQRKSHREIGRLLGVSHVTIGTDVKALMKEWAEAIGDKDSVFNQQQWTLTRWLGLLEQDIESATSDDRHTIIATGLKTLTELGKLHGVYPEKGIGESDYPTGPISVEIQLIPAGNRSLVDSTLYDDGDIEQEN